MAEEGPQIMSVELAMQRELEYRNKVASLIQSDEFMKDLRPLEGGARRCSAFQLARRNAWVNSLNSKFRRSKRMQKMVISSDPSQCPDPSLKSWLQPGPVKTADPCPVQGSSHQLRTSIPNLGPSASPGFCPAPHQIPGRPFQPSSFNQRPSAPNRYPGHGPRPRPRPYPTHHPNYSGTKRKTTSGFQQQAAKKPQPLQESYVIVDSSGNMFCKLCEVSCSGALCLKQHLKGQKHKAKLQLLKADKKHGEDEGNKMPRCDLCQIWCTNEDSLKMHYQGQKHKAKVQLLETGQKSGEKASEHPWCGLCEIWCMNEDAFNQHLKGQKHITRLYSMREIEMENEEKMHSNSFKRSF